MVSQQKVIFVQELSEKIKGKPFGIANVMDIPSSALQQMRKRLREIGFDLKVVRKTLLIKALERLVETNENYKKIIDMIESNKRVTVMLMVPLKEINPFSLNKIFEENKVYRYAKAGDVALEDIVIKAGPTNFTPGPILTEFKKFGIQTKIDGGKISIVEDKVVAKRGDVITPELAAFLQKLDIKPIPIKLRIILFYDGKTIYTEDILLTPLDKYLEDIKVGLRKALALSVEIGYPTRDSIKLILNRAIKIANITSIKTAMPTKENIKTLLSNAIRIGRKIEERMK